MLSRITTLLMLVSASIVSLALIGQFTRFDQRFITFALVLLGMLVLIGTLTQMRVGSASIEDLGASAAQGIRRYQRIRRRYVALFPAPGTAGTGSSGAAPSAAEGAGVARIHRLLVHFENCGFDGAPRFLGIDQRGREILSFIDGFAPPHNGFRLSQEGVRAGARLVRRVHDLTEGTEFAAGSEVACHRNLSQPNFIFRDMIPDVAGGLHGVPGRMRWRGETRRGVRRKSS